MREKFVVSITFTIITNLISIVASYFLALNLDVELMGIWAFLNSTVNLGFLFITIGFDSIHLQYSGEEDFEKYFGSYFIIKIFLIIANALYAFILISFLGLWESEYVLILVFLIFSRAFISFNTIFLTTLRANKKIFKSEIPLFIVRTVRNVIIIYFALNLPQFSEPILFLGFVSFFFDGIIIIIVFLLSKNEFKSNKPKKEFIHSYIKDTKPIILFSILMVIANNVGNLILYYSFGGKSLAYFNIVNNYIISILVIITTSIGPLYLSYYSKYYVNGDIESIRKITHIIEKYSSIFFLSLIIIVFLNGELILLIFLPNYVNSFPILCIMIFIPYLLGLARPYHFQLIPIKRQKESALINTIIQSTSIILMIILIPKQFLGLGVIGYALALTIPRIYHASITHYYSKKYLNIKSQIGIIFHFIIAILSLILSYLLKNYILMNIIPDQLFLLIVSSFMALGIFLLLLFLIKELNKKDIKFIFEILKIKSYYKSLKEEFKD